MASSHDVYAKSRLAADTMRLSRCAGKGTTFRHVFLDDASTLDGDEGALVAHTSTKLRERTQSRTSSLYDGVVPKENAIHKCEALESQESPRWNHQIGTSLSSHQHSKEELSTFTLAKNSVLGSLLLKPTAVTASSADVQSRQRRSAVARRMVLHHLGPASKALNTTSNGLPPKSPITESGANNSIPKPVAYLSHVPIPSPFDCKVPGCRQENVELEPDSIPSTP